MKIRSTYELVTYLDNALSWRKHELTTIFLNLDNCRREHLKATLARSAVPILYAHWEGFTKDAAVAYLEFVSRQKLRYCDLNTNFVATSCRSTIKEVAVSRQTHLYTQLVDFFIFNQTERARFPGESVVDTESNLSSPVLKNILFTLGIPFDNYWQGKILLIDGSLLYLRNRIAHGEREEVSTATYRELHGFVVDALDYLKRTIEVFALNQLYRRNYQPSSPAA